jgi:futalosine hydrolase
LTKEKIDILIVSATEGEVSILKKAVSSSQTNNSQPRIFFLSTGIGMVNTAIGISSFLSYYDVGKMFQLGIAGSFDDKLEMGEVVEVREEIYGEMGAESPSHFLDLQEMGFPSFQKDGKKYHNRLQNPFDAISQQKKVSGLTVSTVSGISPTILQRIEQWNAAIESMEGAPFFQLGIMHDIPFHSFRAISNRVEPRNRDNWQIPLAIKNLNFFFLEKILQQESSDIGKVG